MPVLFDGEEDLSTYPESRQRFRVRLVLVLAVFAAAAVVMAPLAGVIDIFTTRPVAGIDQGTLLLEGLGSNLGVGGYVAGALAVVGGLLACFGIRWGAGLAGGAGLALTGWAALAIGLAEIPVARAEAITRNPTTPDPFVLTITRDVGWFLLAGAGLLGALVFLTSLRLAGRGGHRSLDPWIAAVAAVAPLVMAFGPLVPVGGATFSDNWGSSSAAALPAAIFAGRLIQVGLIATAGVIGFLAVRNYGVGLAVGAVSVALWMWISSLGEIGDTPKGIADRNPGAVDTIPHGVTSIGATLTIAFTIIATVAAIARTQRQPRGR